eukprot:jgi/Mesen1/7069/ME000369S06403
MSHPEVESSILSRGNDILNLSAGNRNAPLGDNAEDRGGGGTIQASRERGKSKGGLVLRRPELDPVAAALPVPAVNDLTELRARVAWAEERREWRFRMRLGMFFVSFAAFLRRDVGLDAPAPPCPARMSLHLYSRWLLWARRRRELHGAGHAYKTVVDLDYAFRRLVREHPDLVEPADRATFQRGVSQVMREGVRRFRTAHPLRRKPLIRAHCALMTAALDPAQPRDVVNGAIVTLAMAAAPRSKDMLQAVLYAVPTLYHAAMDWAAGLMASLRHPPPQGPVAVAAELVLVERQEEDEEEDEEGEGEQLAHAGEGFEGEEMEIELLTTGGQEGEIDLQALRRARLRRTGKGMEPQAEEKERERWEEEEEEKDAAAQRRGRQRTSTSGLHQSEPPVGLTRWPPPTTPKRKHRSGAPPTWGQGSRRGRGAGGGRRRRPPPPAEEEEELEDGPEGSSGADDQQEQRPEEEEEEDDDDGEEEEEEEARRRRGRLLRGGVHAGRAIDMLQGCRSVDNFERLNRIDEGTYGVVYRARDRGTGEVVALKKVKMDKEREGFPLTSLREINILLSFHHASIVDVKEVVVGNNLDSIFMVMEYMEHDVKSLMESMKQPFSQSEVKCLMLQLLSGTKYLHDNWVLHRLKLLNWSAKTRVMQRGRGGDKPLDQLEDLLQKHDFRRFMPTGAGAPQGAVPPPPEDLSDLLCKEIGTIEGVGEVECELDPASGWVGGAAHEDLLLEELGEVVLAEEEEAGGLLWPDVPEEEGEEDPADFRVSPFAAGVPSLMEALDQNRNDWEGCRDEEELEEEAGEDRAEGEMVAEDALSLDEDEANGESDDDGDGDDVEQRLLGWLGKGASLREMFEDVAKRYGVDAGLTQRDLPHSQPQPPASGPSLQARQPESEPPTESGGDLEGVTEASSNHCRRGRRIETDNEE